jgi:phosphoribosylanthranilate isomerase
MLAGGLNAANVAEAIAAVGPWAVDSARSTEREPGIKDGDAVRAWVAAAR